ncbi:hypothetical protein J5I95_08700 [Candidatus Poribacteria bacterium]|nr:hypothetical protein [Candidatus Poribacteria bacterium]
MSQIPVLLLNEKVATLWNALRGSSARQHKKPAMPCFVGNKGNTRERKVSVTGAIS